MIDSLYFRLERFLLFIANGLAACIQGCALGLLTNEQLDRMTAKRYAGSFQSYAESSYLNSGLFLWERAAIGHYFPPSGRVLVAAAGAGREMIALAKSGYRVDGFDCCPPLIECGRKELTEQGIAARLEYAPPSTAPERDREYDAILVGFSGYMYIPGRENRIAFLKNLCGFLSRGAPLMISFMEGFPGHRRTWTARIGTAIRKLRGAAPVEEGDTFKGGFQHHFVYEQIQSEMNEAGLQLIHYAAGTCYGNAVGLVRNG
jgi:2-polyprenyl-3-methyl-5-hydroxy-6-metoxy-1,4-benzoquinol methylase